MDIVYLGRYNESEILTGPEKVAKRIFCNYKEVNESVFYEYYFDGNKYGFMKKLFGKEKICSVNECDVMRLGLFSLFIQLIKIKPKIIHIISFERFALIAFIYRVFFKVEIIYNVHGLVIHENKYFSEVSPFKNYKDGFAEEIFIKYSDYILHLSKKFKILLDKYYNISKRKIRYVKNGVDEEFRLRNDKKSNEDKLKIVFISDISRKEKGFDFLKESLEGLNREVELHVVDSERAVSKVNFKNGLINLYGYEKMNTGELADFLKDKDVFISTAIYEPFGLTCVECMSAGLIPVLTNETGASELITDALNGFTYEYGDSLHFNKILNKLIENPGLRKNISIEASKIFEQLNWKRIFKEYNNIYKDILN